MGVAVSKRRGGGGGPPIEFLVETTGLVSGTTSTFKTWTQQPFGSGADRTIIAMVTAESPSDSTDDIISVRVDPSGVDFFLTKQVQVSNTANGDAEVAGIWSGVLPAGISGNAAIRVTANSNMDSWGLSYVVVNGALSAAARDTASGTADSTSVATSTTLDGQAGGLAVGVAIHASDPNAYTWGSNLTERVDVATGGGGPDHRHGVGYDLLPTGRAAAVETVSASNSAAIALVAATFR